MRVDSCAFLPKARSEGIISKEVDGELLIYDRACDRAHCLNETAAAIWTLCDGRTSVSMIALMLQKAVGSRQQAESRRQKAVGSRQSAAGNADRAERGSSPTVREGLARAAEEQLVWLALDQLRRSRLLKETNGKTFWSPAISGITNMSRREAVRRIGLGAAIALPVVISLTAPTPAQAAGSCGATCHPCNSPVDCCGVCSSSVPGCPGLGNKCT